MSQEKELPKGWVRSTIGDLCQIAVGFAFKSDEFVGDGIRLLRGENIEPGALRWIDTRYWPHDKSEQHQHLLISEGDIILAMDRPVISTGLKLARASASDLPCLLVQRVARIRPKDNACWSFVYWGMQSSDFVRHLLKGQTGTQLPHINTKSISAYEMHLAPLNEQVRVVSKIEELLSDLDVGVAALKRAKANLKRYRAAVLKAAVEGKLTEEWRATHPAKEPASTLLARILKERRQKWEADQLAKFAAAEKEPPKNWKEKYVEPIPPVTTGLPELPTDWCWASVQQVGFVQLGRQRSPQNHNGPHMRPYLRVANVFEDRIDLDDVMEMNFTPQEFETFRLSYGDILLNEGQSMELVGRPAMFRDEMPDVCFTNSLVRFRVYDGVDTNYALKVFLAYLKNGRFQKIATITVNIAHLGAGRFSEIEFPLPPIEEQAAIIEEVDRHFSLIDAAERAITLDLSRAARLRQSILKQAFEGKLVPQDPKDEPASVQLERIKADAHKRSEMAVTSKSNGTPSRKKSAVKST